jgi:hypothetical protein
MKTINQQINSKFSQGFNNIFTPSLLNLFILLSLIIILLLIFFKNNKIDLFRCVTDPLDPLYIPKNSNDTNFFINLINNYTNNKETDTNYQQILIQRDKTIQTLANNINNIFS